MNSVNYPQKRHFSVSRTLLGTNLERPLLKQCLKHQAEFISLLANQLPNNSSVFDIGAGDFRNYVQLIKEFHRLKKPLLSLHAIDHDSNCRDNLQALSDFLN
jgi:hypothetical protein